MTIQNDTCDIDTAASILGISLGETTDLCAAIGGDPKCLGPSDLVEMAKMLRRDSDPQEANDNDEGEKLSPAVCEVCGKEEDPYTADEHWISFATGNSRDLAVDVCPDCEQSDEKLRKAFDVFVSELRLLPKSDAG